MCFYQQSLKCITTLQNSRVCVQGQTLCLSLYTNLEQVLITSSFPTYKPYVFFFQFIALITPLRTSGAIKNYFAARVGKVGKVTEMDGNFLIWCSQF